MRVLMWSDYFWPTIGGTEIFGLNLARGMKELGIAVEVVANVLDSETSNPTLEPDLAIHRLPLRRALAQRDADQIATVRQALTQLFHRFRPTLIHEISVGPGDVWLNTLRERLRVPCLITLQQHIPGKLLAPATPIGRALRSAAHIVATSHAIRTALCDAVPEIATRCTFVHPAPPEDLRPVVAPPAQPRLLCLGRLVEDKGIDIALDAFARLDARHANVRLAIAGDGPQRAPLIAHAQQLDIADRVDFLGWIQPNHTAALIDSATIVVMPSRREPMGLVALEAGVRSRPVVASRVGGLPEVVIDGVSGLLVPPQDATALSRALDRLLREPDTAARMGQAGRAHAQHAHSWQRTFTAYIQLYQQVTAHDPAGA